jgi:hypothetical protein
MPETEQGPSLTRRLVAIVVLAIAAFILLKVVLSVIAGLATVIVVAAALFALVWAWRTVS